MRKRRRRGGVRQNRDTAPLAGKRGGHQRPRRDQQRESGGGDEWRRRAFRSGNASSVGRPPLLVLMEARSVIEPNWIRPSEGGRGRSGPCV